METSLRGRGRGSKKELSNWIHKGVERKERGPWSKREAVKQAANSISQTAYWHLYFWTREAQKTVMFHKNPAKKASFQMSGHVFTTSLYSICDFVKSILRKVCWGHCVPSALVTLWTLDSIVCQVPMQVISIRTLGDVLSPGMPHSFPELLPSPLCLHPLGAHVLLSHE